jgi:hypothetical protein
MPVDEKAQNFKKHLTPVAATAFEAKLFQERHADEFFICPENSKLMMDYLRAKYNGNEDEHAPSYDDFEEAFAHVKEKLFRPNAANLAKLTSEQIKQFSSYNGTPHYDREGKIDGYDWGSEWQHLPPTDKESSKRPKSQMRWPVDFGKKYTARDVALWPADRYREYLESIGAWGHELPEHLR